MKWQIAVAATMTACIGLSACGNGGQPKGQVVAKVGKDEITALDLQGELGGFKAPNEQVRKAVEQRALGAIVERKLLAQAAHDQKLDKTPEFARLQERTDEALLVRSWQDKLVRAVPKPGVDEAQQFVNQHPDLYSARKRFAVDGVRFTAPNDPSLARALQPLNTLADVRALLTERKIPFSSGAGEIDAFTVDPRLVEQAPQRDGAVDLELGDGRIR